MESRKNNFLPFPKQNYSDGLTCRLSIKDFSPSVHARENGKRNDASTRETKLTGSSASKRAMLKGKGRSKMINFSLESSRTRGEKRIMISLFELNIKSIKALWYIIFMTMLFLICNAHKLSSQHQQKGGKRDFALSQGRNTRIFPWKTEKQEMKTEFGFATCTVEIKNVSDKNMGGN